MKQDRQSYWLLAAYSFILLLFTTHSSPLYAFNGWNDVNIHFTIGKGLFNGYVPYVDLIDYKGPFTYLIYGVGWLIDHTGFFGVYLLQSLFLAVSVIHVFRLAKLFIARREMCFLAAILSPLPLLSFGTRGNTGGGIEEFTLALLTVSFYYFTVFFLKPEARLPRHALLQGALFAAVFMMKYNLTAFFGGFAIVAAVLLLRSGGGGYRALGKYLLCFAGGAALVFAPFLVYLLATKSLRRFIDVYFILSYAYTSDTAETSIAARVFAALYAAAQQFVWRFVFDAFIIFAYIFMLARKKVAMALAYSISLLLLVIAIYLGAAFIHYSTIPLSVFLNMGIIALCAALSRLLKEREIKTIVRLVAVAAVFLLIIWRNSLVKNPEFLYRIVPVQKKMAETIWQHARDGSPTLLQVEALDSGFYTAAGLIPQEPYFCTLNVSHEILPEMRDSQLAAVRAGKHEFVVIHTDAENELPNEGHWGLDKNYDRIATLKEVGVFTGRWYHLYQRKW